MTSQGRHKMMLRSDLAHSPGVGHQEETTGRRLRERRSHGGPGGLKPEPCDVQETPPHMGGLSGRRRLIQCDEHLGCLLTKTQ